MDLVHEPVVQLLEDYRVEGAVDLPKLLISAVRGFNQSLMLVFEEATSKLPDASASASGE